MKKKLTTVAVLGLVAAGVFVVKPAEAVPSWLSSAFNTVKATLIQKAGEFASNKFCGEVKSTSPLMVKAQGASCATAIYSKNHSTVKPKTVLGGVLGILGKAPTSTGSDEEVDVWMMDWTEFLDTRVGKVWHTQNSGSIPQDVKDLITEDESAGLDVE